MPASPEEEIHNREQAALAAIKQSYGTPNGEFGATLFVTHHLEELEPSYWQEKLGTDTPEPAQVLNLLQLQSHYGGPDEIDIFDFTLPDEITSYILTVRFEEGGRIEDITMES